MKLLVIGRTGQLARSLLERSTEFPELEVQALGRPDLDLNQPGAGRLIRAIRPHVVVNAAAYTAVDRAEEERDEAFRINSGAAGEIAAAAAEVGAPIIHLSTDYVFNGEASRPWTPDDRTEPLGVYGASKLAGESAVRDANPRHLILRTSWVFSPFGSNFVRTMLRLARDRDEVRVVADQRGCPTSALDLADAILSIADKWGSEAPTGRGQTMHASGAGECSWAEFAETIFAVSAAAGGPSARVVPISTNDYPTPARRPSYSVLDCATFERLLGRRMKPWRETLPEVVRRLLSEP